MTVGSLGKHQIRAATMEDLEEVVEVPNLCSRAEIGKDEYDLKENRNAWASPKFNLATDSRVALTPEGKLIGCASVWDEYPHVRFWCWSRVHPDYVGQGVATLLLDWSEERARQLMLRAPKGARVTMQRSAVEAHVEARKLFLAQGFEVARHVLEMEIELAEPPPPPVWPRGITVRPCTPDEDFRAMYVAADEAFRDHWGSVETPFEEGFEDFSHFLLNDPVFTPELWFLAVSGEGIVGLSLCWPRTTGDPDMAWVEAFAVRRPWRKRGLGLALLRHSFDALYQRGTRRVGLGVDAASLTGATRLYERAGMRVSRRHDTYEKELRSGKELGTQILEEEG